MGEVAAPPALGPRPHYAERAFPPHTPECLRESRKTLSGRTFGDGVNVL